MVRSQVFLCEQEQEEQEQEEEATGLLGKHIRNKPHFLSLSLSYIIRRRGSSTPSTAAGGRGTILFHVIAHHCCSGASLPNLLQSTL